MLLFQVKTENIKMNVAEEAVRQFYPQTASQKYPSQEIDEMLGVFF